MVKNIAIIKFVRYTKQDVAEKYLIIFNAKSCVIRYAITINLSTFNILDMRTEDECVFAYP